MALASSSGPDYEFGVDHTPASYLNVNIDLIVNMPCKCTYRTFLFTPQDSNCILRLQC